MDEVGDGEKRASLVIIEKLTKIKSLHHRHQRILNKAGIYSFRQLAREDSLKICRLFCESEALVSEAVAAYWISKARFLSAKQDAGHDDRKEASREDEAALVWDEITSFYISFQRGVNAPTEGTSTIPLFKTYIDHIDTNDGQSWSGLRLEAPCRWVYLKLKEMLKSRHGIDDKKSDKDQILDFLKICTIRVLDLQGNISNASNNDSFSGVLDKNVPLDVQIGTLEMLFSESMFYPSSLMLSVYAKHPGVKAWGEVAKSMLVNFSSRKEVVHLMISQGFSSGSYDLLFIFSDRADGEVIFCREIENLIIV